MGGKEKKGLITSPSTHVLRSWSEASIRLLVAQRKAESEKYWDINKGTLEKV